MFGSEQNGSVDRDRLPLVLLGGSQGGLAAALEVLGALPRGFPAAIVLVLHRAANGKDFLPGLIAAKTPFSAQPATDRDVLRPGVVHVAPRHRNLVISPDGSLHSRTASRASRSASVDHVFESAAEAMAARTIGVILSGRLDDGAAGAKLLKAAGGRVLVQDPASAEHGSMPAAALATGCVDFSLPPPTLAAALTSLVMVPGASALFQVRLHPGAALAVR